MNEIVIKIKGTPVQLQEAMDLLEDAMAEVNAAGFVLQDAEIQPERSTLTMIHKEA